MASGGETRSLAGGLANVLYVYPGIQQYTVLTYRMVPYFTSLDGGLYLVLYLICTSSGAGYNCISLYLDTPSTVSNM